ncbi:unnamed protein product [Anisakis simplex]|uniref:GLOBIN domain-containing protein n=1 Tax=Anisakis simplex TaxID=6269 RepID=A0A0M3J1D2_ANISI|nr:unnamed protein product [Anisakis simplex]
MEAEIRQLVQTTVEEVISKAEAILNSPYMVSFSSSITQKGFLLRRQRNNGISTNICKSIIDEHDSIEICARDRSKGEEILELDDPQIARAHWIQLFKMNMQMTVIQNTFLQILSNYQHLRPIWCFARNLSDKSESCIGRIRNDKRFIQHCENVLAAMNAIMENLDEPDCRDALLQQLGVNHFFYDVCEPHFEVFHSAFKESMRTTLHGTDALNENLEQAWNMIFEIIKSNMCVGLSTQRYDYLSRRMTPKEFIIVKSTWHKAKVFNTKHLGAKIRQLAIQVNFIRIIRRISSASIPFTYLAM